MGSSYRTRVLLAERWACELPDARVDGIAVRTYRTLGAGPSASVSSPSSAPPVRTSLTSPLPFFVASAALSLTFFGAAAISCAPLAAVSAAPPSLSASAALVAAPLSLTASCAGPRSAASSALRCSVASCAARSSAACWVTSLPDSIAPPGGCSVTGLRTCRARPLGQGPANVAYSTTSPWLDLILVAIPIASRIARLVAQTCPSTTGKSAGQTLEAPSTWRAVAPPAAGGNAAEQQGRSSPTSNDLRPRAVLARASSHPVNA